MLLSALALLACTGTKNDSTTGDSQAADSGTTDTDTNSGDSGMGDTAATPAACPSRKPHDIPGAHWEDMYAGPAIVDYDPALFVPVPPKRRGSLTDTSLYRHVAATHALAA